MFAIRGGLSSGAKKIPLCTHLCIGPKKKKGGAGENAMRWQRYFNGKKKEKKRGLFRRPRRQATGKKRKGRGHVLSPRVQKEKKRKNHEADFIIEPAKASDGREKRGR